MAEDDTNILEEGDIFFLYRPDVENNHPDSMDDIQRFYLVLRPRGGKHTRLLVVGDKKLPDVDEHQRFWGFVDMVANESKTIEKELRSETYDTKTEGERCQPAARPAGEGAYAFISPAGEDMHLVYALELPEEIGRVQKAFNIEDKGAFVVSIKNPEKGSPENAGLSDDDKADYPKSLQEEFRGRRFAPCDPHLLDYEGAEFVLIGARPNPEKAYDVDIDTDESGRPDIFTKLRMARSRHPVEPLFEGEWA
ncbi:MAG TPA: hypothetical protein VFI88_02825 [Sphingomicrobium sp.]|jgi:hypothetical protein|nr:hypothetical protein [Sphingomicrobium sp.]